MRNMIQIARKTSLCSLALSTGRLYPMSWALPLGLKNAVVKRSNLVNKRVPAVFNQMLENTLLQCCCQYFHHVTWLKPLFSAAWILPFNAVLYFSSLLKVKHRFNIQRRTKTIQVLFPLSLTSVAICKLLYPLAYDQVFQPFSGCLVANDRPAEKL